MKIKSTKSVRCLLSFAMKEQMAASWKLFVVCLLASVISADAQKPDTLTAGNTIIDVNSFNANIKQMMHETGIPGMSLAIIDNNRIIFSNAYGYRKPASNKKINANTVFEAASLSKSFLVFIAHKLVDEGRLDLDKPMYLYLKHELLEYDQRYKLITPRMILSHSSGIENWKPFNDPDTLEIVSNPGEKFEYSGEGFQYLAKVIESILNKPYERYVKDMVIRPLDLKRTFTRFTFKKMRPANYASGQSFFGKEIDKWKIDNPVPASGNHVIANDFAKLIIATFDEKHLSSNRVKDITAPNTSMVGDKSVPLYMGAGYIVNYTNDRDTIVSFAGSNDGYKSWISYSIVSKKGFVFFTNSDIGVAMLNRLNELSVDLDIGLLLKAMDFPQYPNELLTLLKIYNEKNPVAMFDRIRELGNKSKGELTFGTLNNLGWIIFKNDKNTARNIMEENTKLHPDNAEGYYNLGRVNMSLDQYKLAHENFSKCKLLNFQHQNLESDLKACEEKLSVK